MALLCVSLMLTACGANDDSNGTAQTEQRSDSSISNSDGTTPEIENQEPEEQVVKDDSIEKIQAAEPEANVIKEAASEGETSEKEQTSMKMNVQVGTYTFTATLENNDAVQELTEMMQSGPVTINMSDYSGFEKVGPLGRNLTTSNSQTTTTAGDIVLYNGNNIVMFYGSNSWSYTRIGKIDDLTDWEAALGGGDITATFSLAG